MTVLEILKDEFQLKRFGFSDVEPGVFHTFMWRLPPIVHLLYRLLLSTYTIVWISITASEFTGQDYPWEVFLTNWSYTCLTIYLFLHLLVALFHHCFMCKQGSNIFNRTSETRHRENINLSRRERLNTNASSNYNSIETEELATTVETPSTLPFYLKIVWVIFNIISVAAVMVTAVFWISIYPHLDHSTSLGNENIQLHILNSVIMILEHCTSAIPVRLLHVLHPFLYGLIYCIFSAIYWATDHIHVIYPILDWNKAGVTFGYVVLIGFVLVPVIHLLFFLIYRLKIYIYKLIDVHE